MDGQHRVIVGTASHDATISFISASSSRQPCPAQRRTIPHEGGVDDQKHSEKRSHPGEPHSEQKNLHVEIDEPPTEHAGTGHLTNNIHEQAHNAHKQIRKVCTSSAGDSVPPECFPDRNSKYCALKYTMLLCGMSAYFGTSRFSGSCDDEVWAEKCLVHTNLLQFYLQKSIEKIFGRCRTSPDLR